jgi:hypothetical protein
MRAGWFGRAAGFLTAIGVLFAAGEAFLRWSPPSDFRPYLGDASGLTGPYRPDARFAVQYRSWHAFENEYRDRLHQMKASSVSPRTWAMFGNSFVHMDGMLADTMRAAIPDRPIFNLAKNEPLPVRLSQIELLLDHGMRPERIFFILLPHDSWPFAQHSLDQIRVTKDGGIGYEPRKPAALASVLDRSRLALLGWIRAGRHEAIPGFRPSSINHAMPTTIVEDFRRLMNELAEIGRRRDVPITVVLIPNFEQITRGAGFPFQDALTPICHDAGLDVCDVREPFLAVADKASLFIPDKHFSPSGNAILLDSILTHQRRGALPWRLTGGGPRK